MQQVRGEPARWFAILPAMRQAGQFSTQGQGRRAASRRRRGVAIQSLAIEAQAAQGPLASAGVIHCWGRVGRLSENPVAQQLQEVVGWKHDQTILDAPFTVGAHTFRYYKFSLPEGSVNVAIVGQFSAANVESRVVTSGKAAAKDKEKDKTGDSENGIEVSVLTEPAFTVWQNGYATSSIYDSGKVVEGKVQADVPAGAGIYYLVFNNKFAPKTAKNVHAAVVLRYKSWLPESFRKMKETVWNWLGL
jgi:hypothetical protein